MFFTENSGWSLHRIFRFTSTESVRNVVYSNCLEFCLQKVLGMTSSESAWTCICRKYSELHLPNVSGIASTKSARKTESAWNCIYRNCSNRKFSELRLEKILEITFIENTRNYVYKNCTELCLEISEICIDSKFSKLQLQKVLGTNVVCRKCSEFRLQKVPEMTSTATVWNCVYRKCSEYRLQKALGITSAESVWNDVYKKMPGIASTEIARLQKLLVYRKFSEWRLQKC